MTRESSIRRKTHQPLSYNLLQLNVIKRSRQPFTVLVLAVNLLWLEDCPSPRRWCVPYRKAWCAVWGVSWGPWAAAVEEPVRRTGGPRGYLP